MSDAIEVLHQGRFLRLLKNGRWEYVQRVRARGAAFILALTDDHEVVLVEQYRVPVQTRVIELPAGIIGDEAAFADEAIEAAALRELEEETGYRGGRIERLLSAPTAPGLTGEMAHLFLVTQLQRIHDGGGVDGEDITVHRVPLAQLRGWLAQRVQAGVLVDTRIHAGLWLAEAHLPQAAVRSGA
jgi:ADP-ribose pyrophosphatase